MAKFVWSGAQDTNWFNANNWNPAIVPGANALVVIPAGLANYPVIADGGGVSLSGSLNDAGSLSLNSTGDETNLILNGGTTFTLSGGGALVLSDNSDNRIYSTQSGTVLDNVNATIMGAGQIFANGALSIINEAGGVINASGVTNALNISSIAVTNKGLLEATNTGGLVIYAVPLDQSAGGTLSAAGGNVILNATTVVGGTLKSSGGGLIESVSATLDGSGALPITITAGATVLITDANSLKVLGIIDNLGTIKLTSGQDGVHFDTTDLNFVGSITDKLQGGGVVQLSDSANNRIFSTSASTVLENVDDSITGAGQIFSNGNLSVLNDSAGVITASAAINALNVYSISLTNNGLVNSTSTGGLLLTSVTLDQSTGAGTLSAAGGDVHLNATTILGGNLVATGTSLIETSGSNSVLNGTGTHAVSIAAASTVQVNDANNLTLDGVIDNLGTIKLTSGQDGMHFDNTDLLFNGSITDKLEGGGVVQLSDSANNRILSTSGSTVLENVDNSITGAGQITANGDLSVLNDAAGVINASSANNALNIFSVYLTNNGLVTSTSTGGLTLNSITLDQSTGAGTLSAAGGNVNINATSVLGGTLTTTGTSLIETSGSSSAFNGTAGHAVTITAGSKVQINDANNLSLVGVINNRGTITLTSGQDGVHNDNTDLLFSGSVTDKLQGGGVVQLSDSAGNRIFSYSATTVLENVDDNITGAGQIFSNGDLSILNDAAGVINASAANNALSLSNLYLTNNGMVKSTSTGGLTLTSTTLDQTTGAGVLAAAGGNISLNATTIRGGTISTTGVNQIMTSGNGSVLDGSTATVTIAAGSTVSITDANNVAIMGTINNVGAISLRSGQNGVNFDNTDLLIQGGQTVTLTGGGVVQMVTGSANRIFSYQASTVLDNVNNRITGSGQIFSNGNLSIINESAGVIRASNTGQTLSLTSISVTNKGLITTVSDGVLTLNSTTLTQSGAGNLWAADGNILFNASHIIGGKITSSGGYVVATNGNGDLLDGSSSIASIATGSTVLDTDSVNLSLTGTIANSGVILLDSGQDGVHFDNTDLLINGATTLTGGGAIVLSNSGANRLYSNVGGSVLTNSNQTIMGVGQIFSNGNLSITNSSAGVIEANGGALSLALSVTNAGVLEGNSGTLSVSGAVTGAGTAMVANGGAVRFTGSTALGGLTYSGPFAGTITLPSGVTPTITGFAAGDTLAVLSGLTGVNFQFVENSGNASGVLTFYQMIGGVQSNIESFTLNGFYTTQDFGLASVAGGYGAVGVGDVWTGGSANWNTAGDWTQGPPGVDDDVVINSGSPNVSAAIGTVRSLSVLGAGSLNFAGVTGNAVSGAIYDLSSLSLDAGAGQGGATLTGGSLNVGPGASLSLGSATLSADDKLSVGALVNNTGSITLIGSATKQALLNISGAAGVSAVGVLTGAFSLAGDSAIEFGSGHVQTIDKHGALTLNGSNAFVETAGSLGSNSTLAGLSSVVGALSLENGATVSANTSFYVSGVLNVDDVSGAGGTLQTLTTYYNEGALNIGNAAMTAASRLNVTNLRNSGAITLTGGATAQALLDVTSGAAGFDGVPGALVGVVSLSGTSAIEFASSSLSSIVAGSSLRLVGSKAFIEASTALGSNSALAILSTDAGALSLESGASVTTTTVLSDTGALSLDTLSGEGGSQLNVAGLKISGQLAIGTAGLSSATVVQARSLTNTGSITLRGSSGFQALLDVSGGAGFGTAGVLTGIVDISGDSAIEFANSSLHSIAAGSSLRLAGGSAFVEDATTLGSNSALNGLQSNAGALTLDSNQTIVLTGAFANTNAFNIDVVAGEGGSHFTTPSSLTNSGGLTLGNSTLSTSDQINALSLSNSGAITLTGDASTHQALIDVGTAAGFGTAGVLSGTVTLAGDAAIEFASSSVTTVAAGASLIMTGGAAFIETATALGQNSALNKLTSDLGLIALHGGVAIASTNGLTIGSPPASLLMDASVGEGGSNVSFGGRLTNAGTLTVGNATLSSSDSFGAATLTNTGSISVTGSLTKQALLSIGSGALFASATQVTGSVTIVNDAALEFMSGSLTGVVAGASLILNGPNAFVEQSSALNANSALTSFAQNSGVFELLNGVVVSSTNGIVNAATLEVADTANGAASSSLTTTHTLTNTGNLSIFAGTGGATETVTVASLNNTGSISLNSGNGAALLNVTSGVAGFGVAGQVRGTVTIGNNSGVEFVSGSITSIVAGASLELAGALSGITGGFLEDSTALGSNSALNLLSTIAGVLQIDYSATIASTMSITNSGKVNIDNATGGGGSLSTTGAFTNTGSLNIGAGPSLTGTASLSAASLSNTGSINLYGGASMQALVTISGAASFGTAGVLRGNVTLTGDSALSFGSGRITSTVAGSLLRLNGGLADLEIGVTSSNSALTSLTTVAGVVDLDNGASINDGTGLAITGGLFLDSFPGEGGSSFADSVSINNSGTLNLGNASSAAGSSLTTASLTNTGFLNLTGNGVNHFAQANVSASMTNNGSVNVISDAETLAASVSGTGTFDLWNGSDLNFSAAVGANQTVTFDNPGTLGVNATGNMFQAAIAAFGTGDTIQISNFAGAGATVMGFAENGSNTAGVLTLSSGTNTATLNFNGLYSQTDFHVTGTASAATLTFV